MNAIRRIQCLWLRYTNLKQRKQRRDGFFNGIILNESYVIGANSNEYLNLFSLIIFAGSIGVYCVYIFFRIKKNNKKLKQTKMYLYPKWIRAWHIINALMFLILIVTGLSMQYTDKENTSYMVGFAIAVKWHNFAAIVLTINYIIFVTGNLFTKNGRYYKIKKENFVSDLIIQVKYYSFGMFKGEKHPFPVTEERNSIRCRN